MMMMMMIMIMMMGDNNNDNNNGNQLTWEEHYFTVFSLCISEPASTLEHIAFVSIRDIHVHFFQEPARIASLIVMTDNQLIQLEIRGNESK